MGTVGRYWRTVRYLKPQQIVARVLFRLPRPGVQLRPAPPLRSRDGKWVLPARREPSLVAPSRLKLLNVERDLDDGGWDDQRVDRLWRYNLHYFDDLNARDAEERRPWQRELLNRWLAENPPGRGTGWEPYPVSLRIVNLIKAFSSGMTPEAVWLDSLAAQARWLRRRLEWHLLGNHLLANAKALVFAGSFFKGDEADEWLRCGLDIMRRELEEQVLPDGGHFERSPMYHALCLEDLLDILNLTTALSPSSRVSEPDRDAVLSAANRMLHWLRCLRHADGTLASFNDSAQGVCPDLDELERYAAAVGATAEHPPPEGILVLRDSGYIRAARGAAVALLDVAPIGPDYLPGHAHADTLSFELSLGKQRVVVNGGTSSYGASAVRQRERGTGAHSTVQVGGADSSEVWGSFRVGRRARPSTPIVAGSKICCSHDGYRFLPGKPEHRRCWQLDLGALTVRDTVAPSTVGAVARYLLAPGLRLDRVSAKRWNVVGERGHVTHVEVLLGHAEARKAQHAPQFGVTLPVDCLAITLVDGAATSCWHWTDDAHSILDG
jgi:heparinase II/III-like protein